MSGRYWAVILLLCVCVVSATVYDWRGGKTGQTEENVPVGGTVQENLGASIVDYLVEPSIENLDTSEATPAKTSALVDNANQFAFEIYSELAENDSNTFLSPYSIHTCLAMVYEGARGETASEMEEALNLPADENLRRPAFADLQKQLNTDREVELKTANALWPQENYPFYEKYLDTIRNYYLASIAPLDYIGNPDGAVERINNWAAEHTENKIKEVIKEGDVTPLTRWVLTNAIYFKGNWIIPFDNSLTDNETFYLSNGSTVETPMMQFHENTLEENEFFYAETEDIKALRLLYSGENVSMTFLLPKDQSNGIGWLKNNVDWGTFENIENNLTKTKMGEIKIPKFEFEVEYKEKFKSALQSLGMNAAFDPSSADFTGMTEGSLFISKAIHKAYIKVDEVGTEAVAVTVVVGGFTSAPPPPPSFVANHPFMFVIKDEITGSILFIGSVANPQEG